MGSGQRLADRQREGPQVGRRPLLLRLAPAEGDGVLRAGGLPSRGLAWPNRASNSAYSWISEARRRSVWRPQVHGPLGLPDESATTRLTSGARSDTMFSMYSILYTISMMLVSHKLMRVMGFASADSPGAPGLRAANGRGSSGRKTPAASLASGFFRRDPPNFVLRCSMAANHCEESDSDQKTACFRHLLAPEKMETERTTREESDFASLSRVFQNSDRGDFLLARANCLAHMRCGEFLSGRSATFASHPRQNL